MVLVYTCIHVEYTCVKCNVIHVEYTCVMEYMTCAVSGCVHSSGCAESAKMDVCIALGLCCECQDGCVQLWVCAESVKMNVCTALGVC